MCCAQGLWATGDNNIAVGIPLPQVAGWLGLELQQHLGYPDPVYMDLFSSQP